MEDYLPPDIIEFICWEDIDGNVISYKNWDEKLLNCLFKYLEIIESGSKTFGLPSIPTQIKYFKYITTFISSEDAKNLYLAHLAVSLFVSRHNPEFSICKLSPNDKTIILDSRSLFNASPNDKGYFVSYDIIGRVSPSDPLELLKFMEDQGIIGKDHVDTIVNLLVWCHRLTHFTGKFSNKDNVIDHWGYDGYPSVSLVIEGTIRKSDKLNSRKHYTAGCHGTVGVICLLLKILNIPVKPVIVGGHSLAIFSSIGAFLSHGDDPYNRNLNPSYELYKKLLIDLIQFDELYIKNLSPVDNVGIGPIMALTK